MELLLYTLALVLLCSDAGNSITDSSSALLDGYDSISEQVSTSPYTLPTPAVIPSTDLPQSTVATDPGQWIMPSPWPYFSSDQVLSEQLTPFLTLQPSTLARDSTLAPAAILTYSSLNTQQLSTSSVAQPLLYSSPFLLPDEQSAGSYSTSTPQPPFVPQPTQDSLSSGVTSDVLATSDVIPYGSVVTRVALLSTPLPNAESAGSYSTATLQPSFVPQDSRSSGTAGLVATSDTGSVATRTALYSTPLFPPFSYTSTSEATTGTAGLVTPTPSTSGSLPPSVTVTGPSSLCFTPPPSPPGLSESRLVASARCRTGCLNYVWSSNDKNIFNQKNYPGSPYLLIVPDSYLCATSNVTFNRIWECTNACANFSSSTQSCSTNCYSNCTATCSSGLCSNYYPPSTPCRTRTCSQSYCSDGCTVARSSTASSPPRLQGSPQIISVPNLSNFYRINISSALPRFITGSTFVNLIVKVQRANSSSLPTYYWLVSTEDLLDFTPFSCQNVSISFALASNAYNSFLTYSSPLNFQVPPALTDAGTNSNPSTLSSPLTSSSSSSSPPTSLSPSSSPPTPLLPSPSSTAAIQTVDQQSSMTMSDGMQLTLTTVMVPSPTPRPQFNLSRGERDAIRRASCHTWCIKNIVPKFAQDSFSQGNFPGSPIWLIVPDSNICQLNTYSSVWECRDACVNYGNMVNCSSTCVSNCSSCPCSNYYTSQPSTCRTRICSQSACNVGCNRTAPSSDLPSQYRPLTPPRLIETDVPNTFLLDILSAVPSPSPAPPALLSNLVVKVQSVGRETPPTYYWLVSTQNSVNLSSYAGSTVNVSFAVVSYLYGGALLYSDPVTMFITDKFPSQLSTFDVVISPDVRSGYFGYVVLMFSWTPPVGVDYLKNYTVAFTPATSFTPGAFLSCSFTAFNRTLPPSATNLILVAPSLTGSINYVECGCNLNIQIFAKPVLPTLTAPKKAVSLTSCNALFTENDVSLQCMSMWNVTSSMFRYNITWTLNSIPSILTALSAGSVSLQSSIGTVSRISISASQLVYTFIQSYSPNIKDGQYSFTATFSARLSNGFQQPSVIVTKTCAVVAMPPVTQVNATTPIAQWVLTGPQALLLLGIQLYWQSPVADALSYNVWVGTEADQRGTGTLQSFMVQQNTVAKRQSSAILTYNLFINVSFDLMSLNPSSLLTLYIQLRTMRSTELFSDWSAPFVFAVPVNLSIPAVPISTAMSSATLHYIPTSPVQNVTAAPVVEEAAPTLLLAIVVPCVVLLMLAIIVVLGILCVIRSKNKIILGEQTNLGLSEGRTLQDLLCEKVSVIDDWEIDPNDVVVFVDQKLGEGAFGEVYKGTVSGSCLSKNLQLLSEIKKAVFVPVAIKVLKSTAQGKEKQDFMNEIEMMKRITSGNPHIVNMIGCVTRSEPVCLMCELVTYGSLLSYLRTHQKKGTQKAAGPSRVTVTTTGTIVRDGTGDSSNDAAAPYLEPGSEYSHLEPEDGLGPLEENDLLTFAYQISDGMQHLASLNIVHRDLACRNILIGENKTLKITDFGLSREVEEVYEVKGKRKLPWRWMAIESLERRIFTTYSDVWSFGITLWEISTFGGFPYPSVSNDDLLKRLKSGYRMEKPENCSNEIYMVMLECWLDDPHQRPSFSQLKSKFEVMLQLSASDRDQPYIDLTLDTNQYVYIPDGIEEEDEDPNRAYLAPITLSKSSAQQTASKMSAVESAASNTVPTDLDQRQKQEATGRGVCLARMGSNNPYIDYPQPSLPTSPIKAKDKVAEETEL